MLPFETLAPLVDKAARIAASSFPSHHDIEDVKQSIWVWVMEKKSFVAEALQREGGEKTITNIMVKEARTALKKEDAAVYGYAEEDRFHYSIDLIKKILEVIFQHEDWQSFATALDAMPRSRKDPSLGGDNLASYADVKSAVEKLPEDYYNLVVWRYKYQRTLTQIGAETDTTQQGASKRHERALKAIQKLLGEAPLSELRNGFDGRTEARGNTAMQARTERDYEG